MNLVAANLNSGQGCVPRASGDEPRQRPTRDQMLTCSPRQRG